MALSKVVKIDSKYAAEYQLTVIDCLEAPDETLQRKTLELLYLMTNQKNIVSISDKMLK